MCPETVPTRSDARALAQELATEIETRHGAATAELRALRRHWSRRLRHADAVLVLAVARQLLREASEPRRWMVYELLNHHGPALRAIGRRELTWLGRGMGSWGAVDAFACYVAGPAWRQRQVPTRVVEGWARSPDRWWRRAALVSTVALNVATRGGSGDASRTLRICAMLVDDRDDMVVKALSWALRSLVSRAPDAVRGFLSQHETRLAARVKREVQTKLTTGLKQARRR